MVTIDFVMLGLISIGIVRGVMTGGIKQILSLGGVIVALLLATPLSDFTSRQILKFTDVAEEFIPILSFLVIFVLVQIGAFILARMVESFLEAIKLGALDKLVGGFLGASKAVLLVGIILFAMRFLGIPNREARDESLLYSPIYHIVPATWQFLVGRVPDVSDLEEELDSEKTEN